MMAVATPAVCRCRAEGPARSGRSEAKACCRSVGSGEARRPPSDDRCSRQPRRPTPSWDRAVGTRLRFPPPADKTSASFRFSAAPRQRTLGGSAPAPGLDATDSRRYGAAGPGRGVGKPVAQVVGRHVSSTLRVLGQHSRVRQPRARQSHRGQVLPPSTRAMFTVYSSVRRRNSLVPSSGSTSQKRCQPRRSSYGSWADSSDRYGILGSRARSSFAMRRSDAMSASVNGDPSAFSSTHASCE